MDHVLCPKCGRGIGFWTGPDEGPCQHCPVAPSYEMIHNETIELFRSRYVHAELIVGIQRGGLVPAVLLSHFLGIPMEAINYSSTTGRGDNRTEHSNRIPHFDAESILLVDDINDTGYTMREVADEYVRRGVVLTTFVLHHKQTSVFYPDLNLWSIPADGPWIHYPWELDA